MIKEFFINQLGGSWEFFSSRLYDIMFFFSFLVKTSCSRKIGFLDEFTMTISLMYARTGIEVMHGDMRVEDLASMILDLHS